MIRLSRAFTALIVVATLIVGFMTLSAATKPHSDLGDLVFAIYGWGFIGLVWVLSFLVAKAVGDVRPALVAPVLVVLIAALTFSGLPRRALVAWNDRQLSDLVAAADAGHIASPPDWNRDRPISVGGVPVYWFERHAGTTHLISGFVGSDTPAGLVRLPDGELQSTGFRYEHIHGDWYRWFPW